MTSGMTGLRWTRAWLAALALALSLALGAAPALAADPATPSQEQSRFIAVARQLEQTPLAPHLAPEREWALLWLTQTQDVSVTLCGDALGGLIGSGDPHAAELMFSYMFSMAAAVLERPEIVNDPVTQQVAGVEGTLRAYRSVLRDHPQAVSPHLEAIAQRSVRGELPAFLGTA